MILFRNPIGVPASIVICMMLLAAPATLKAAGPVNEQRDGVFPPPCSNRGELIDVGQQACIDVDSSPFLARCVMVLNNPSWEKVQDGCPRQTGSGTTGEN